MLSIKVNVKYSASTGVAVVTLPENYSQHFNVPANLAKDVPGYITRLFAAQGVEASVSFKIVK